jgi:predicted transcriptional regulator
MEHRRGHGDLAQAILELIGRADTAMTPAQVRDALDRQLAYTTVMTVMARLHERGLLTRTRAGRAFAYTAIGDPANVTARRMHRLLDIEQDRVGVLARFVDGLTEDDEQVLRGLLDQITADQDTPTPPKQGSSSRRKQP